MLGQSSKLNVEQPRLPNGDPKGKGKALVQDEPAGPTGCQFYCALLILKVICLVADLKQLLCDHQLNTKV